MYKRQVLNIATVNSFVIWKASNCEKKLLRHDFIKEVGMSLVKPHVEERKMESRNISRDLKSIIDQVLGEKTEIERPIEVSPGSSQSKKPKTSRCHICPRSKDTKTTKTCSNCGKFICKTHSIEKKVCVGCDD